MVFLFVIKSYLSIPDGKDSFCNRSQADDTEDRTCNLEEESTAGRRRDRCVMTISSKKRDSGGEVCYRWWFDLLDGLLQAADSAYRVAMSQFSPLSRTLSQISRMIRSAISTHRDLTNFIETTPSSCGIIGRRFKDQFPPWDATSRGANGRNPPARWVVNQLRWKCYVLSLLRMQHPDCELCNAREKYGEEMRRRLEELNWPTQPQPLNNGDHGGAVGGFDSKPAEVLASPPISLAQQQKKVA